MPLLVNIRKHSAATFGIVFLGMCSSTELEVIRSKLSSLKFVLAISHGVIYLMLSKDKSNFFSTPNSAKNKPTLTRRSAIFLSSFVTLVFSLGAALFLLSDMSSGVTGENLHVDSGYHIVGMKAEDAPDIDVVTGRKENDH